MSDQRSEAAMLSGDILATATVVAAIRWREDAHLFAIAVIAFSLGLYGYRASTAGRKVRDEHRHREGTCTGYVAQIRGAGRGCPSAVA